jgi:restriction endonuclease S subunit
MVKAQSLQLSTIAKEQSNRLDVDFSMFQGISERRAYLRLGALFDIVEKENVELPEEFKYCEIGHVEKTGDIDPVLLNENQRNELNENYFKKIEKGDILKPDIGDILISSVRPNLKKFVYIDKDKEGTYFTKAFIHLRPKRNGLLLYYLLRSVFFENIIFVSRQGKGYPTLKNSDLLCLNFDKLTVEKIFRNQDKLLPAIKKIEGKIKILKSKIQKPQDIIDKVFSDEFGYDLKILAKARQEKGIEANFSDYSKGEDLRFGFRFHNAAGRTALKILRKFTQKRISDYLSEPIKLGAGISPNYYDDENGEAYYLTMATIKNWQYEIEEAKKVSKEYWESEQKKNSIRNDDVIIARSGEGTIGKVAIIEDIEVEAIYCDFTMRVRFANYNPHFAYYYFRTTLFQTLIESNKKGLGNNTNIFPSQVQDFPLPDIPLSRQDKIVSVIKIQLRKQEAKLADIEQKQHEIEKLIKNILIR